MGAHEGVSPVGVNEAVLLIGHGSARYPDAGRVLQGHARRLAAAGPFREVEVGLLNGAPPVAEALARLSAPVVRVVPFFMEDGYFARVAVPRALGPGGGPWGGPLGGARRLVLCPPVGVHDGMATLIERRVRDGCSARGLDPAATAVLVVGHGSARAPGRALALHRHAATVAATGAFAKVTTACLEEAPFVPEALRGLCSCCVAVVGFFAGVGGHVRDDVPGLIAAEQAARRSAGLGVHNFGSVTDDPSMAGIILDQAQAA